MLNFKNKDKKILKTIIFMVVSYAWISLLAALFGIFYPIAIWSVWSIICLIFYFKKFILLHIPSKNFLTYILIATSFSLLIAYFTVPTIFSGRDQGALAEASMRLSEEHSLIKHTPESSVFFDIYGRGKALNFPGFFYTADGGLITQFPLPYISFLGGFYGVFGITGFIIANCILLFTFIITITSAAMHFMNHRYILIFLAIFLSSFSIGWFAKFTLSENFAAAILWSAFALYLILKKSPSRITFFLFFLTISILLFSRIEGIWFFFIFLFLVLRNTSVQNFIKKDLWWRVFFPSTVLFVIACTVTIMNLPFILTMIQVSTNTVTETIHPTSFIAKTSYLFSIYTLYGLILPLIITGIASLFALRYKKYRKLILPIVIALPLMIYYIFPHISGDHPWMLRRFVFALLPATILISVTFISYIRSTTTLQHTTKYILLTLLLLANIPASITFITYAENATLAEQISDISQNFGTNDLVLVDKNAAGNGWSMITNPLRLDGKHAVYFFNPHDFAKMDTSAFNRVFLITSRQNNKMYADVLMDKMNYITKYSIATEQLLLPKTKIIPPTFPQKRTAITKGIIYELKN